MVWLVMWNDHDRSFVEVYRREEDAKAFAEELINYHKQPIICPKEVK